MLKSDYSKNNALENVPVNDLAEVIKLASEMQESSQLQYSEKQSEEQIRLATIELAKDLGIEKTYLAQAAEALRKQKKMTAEQTEIDHYLQDKEYLRRRNSIERNLTFGFLILISLGLMWLLSLFLTTWIAITIVTLTGIVFFLKWLYIDS